MMYKSLLMVQCFLFVWTGFTVVHASMVVPAEEEAEEEIIIDSFDDDFLYDVNGKLKTHLLVYPRIGQESPAGLEMYGFHQIALTGAALKRVFPNYDPDGDTWVAACLERGTDHSVAGYTLPNKHYDSDILGNTDFRQWFTDNCRMVEMCLANWYNPETPLKIYWVQPTTGLPVYLDDLPYYDDKVHCISAFLGHKFQILAAAGNDGNENGNDSTKMELLEEYIVEHYLVKTFGEAPASATWDPQTNLTAEVEKTFRYQWKRRSIVKRTFSSLGFAKGRLPPDVFASMGSLYYNNRSHKSLERWENKGYYVNWWQSNVYMIEIPSNIKKIWQLRLANLVSEWAQVEVEQTFMYGLRQYETNARLLSHVDTIRTHAVSLIVNIAQGNLAEPWPIEVFDHYGRLHEVLLEPGDIVYYESAKNIHSRNRPMKGNGAYYCNLFTHYRPVEDGSDWYTKSTPENVPKPIMEVEGDCQIRSTTTIDDVLDPKYLGQVKCDDPRLGDYISPTLFEVHGPDDMMEWWLRTSPVNHATAVDKAAETKDEL